jgi:hypothetical protein
MSHLVLEKKYLYVLKIPPKRKKINKKTVHRPTVVIKQAPLNAREMMLQQGKTITTAAMPHSMSVRDALMQRMQMGITPVPTGSNAAEMAMNEKFNSQKAMNDKTQNLVHDLQARLKQETERKSELKHLEVEVKDEAKRKDDEVDFELKKKRLEHEKEELKAHSGVAIRKQELINQETLLLETKHKNNMQRITIENMEQQKLGEKLRREN